MTTDEDSVTTDSDMAQKPPDEDEGRETVVPWRTNPRKLLRPVVDDIEFVERGEWKVTTTGAVYRDVMVGGLFMEGYRVGSIEHVEGETFTFEVIENYDLEDQEKYLGGGE